MEEKTVRALNSFSGKLILRSLGTGNRLLGLSKNSAEELVQRKNPLKIEGEQWLLDAETLEVLRMRHDFDLGDKYRMRHFENKKRSRFTGILVINQTIKANSLSR